MEDHNVAARRLVERLGGTVVERRSFPDGRVRDLNRIPSAGAAARQRGTGRRVPEVRTRRDV